MSDQENKASGYDKLVNWKIFSIPVILFLILLMMPTPYGMKDMGTEVKIGPKAVIDSLTKALFSKGSGDVEQWQLLTAQIMEQSMRMGILEKKTVSQTGR